MNAIDRLNALMSTQRPLIMGVVNVTPDSFFDGGEHGDTRVAIDHALRLIDEGADIIDVGGESTRPPGRDYGDGAIRVESSDEIGRVVPVIRGITTLRPGVVVSVDTMKPGVAAHGQAGSGRRHRPRGRRGDGGSASSAWPEGRQGRQEEAAAAAAHAEEEGLSGRRSGLVLHERSALGDHDAARDHHAGAGSDGVDRGLDDRARRQGDAWATRADACQVQRELVGLDGDDVQLAPVRLHQRCDDLTAHFEELIDRAGHLGAGRA